MGWGLSGGSDQRIACRKVWKATEVAIGGYEFTHAVPETQGRDACVMRGSARFRYNWPSSREHFFGSRNK